jgi:hypothetical protein
MELPPTGSASKATILIYAFYGIVAVVSLDTRGFEPADAIVRATRTKITTRNQLK